MLIELDSDTVQHKVLSADTIAFKQLFELNHKNMRRLMLHAYGFGLMADEGQLPAGTGRDKEDAFGSQ